jgi:hypothetical protein
LQSRSVGEQTHKALANDSQCSNQTKGKGGSFCGLDELEGLFLCEMDDAASGFLDASCVLLLDGIVE